MSNGLLYKVAYDEAVRGLSEQQAVADSLRNRAGTLLPSAAITASFLGAQALGGGNPNLPFWLAMLCFAGVAAASLAVFWPRDWEVAANPREMIDTYIEAADAGLLEELHRDLSIHMHNSYLQNREGLDQLALLLQAASGLLALEVVLWMIALVVRL
jgi:hypothetical protein